MSIWLIFSNNSFLFFNYFHYQTVKLDLVPKNEDDTKGFSL